MRYCSPYAFQSTCSVRSKTWITSLFLWITIFQSTCSVRSKTHANQLQAYYMPFQSTCSVRSKTAQAAENERLRAISIAPCGARLSRRCVARATPEISIHLLRAEQDEIGANMLLHNMDFNPLAPCGARRYRVEIIQLKTKISIHLLRAEQDPTVRLRLFAEFISIHLLRAEQDSKRS